MCIYYIFLISPSFTSLSSLFSAPLFSPSSRPLSTLCLHPNLPLPPSLPSCCLFLPLTLFFVSVTTDYSSLDSYVSGAAARGFETPLQHEPGHILTGWQLNVVVDFKSTKKEAELAWPEIRARCAASRTSSIAARLEFTLANTNVARLIDSRDELRVIDRTGGDAFPLYPFLPPLPPLMFSIPSPC